MRMKQAKVSQEHWYKLSAPAQEALDQAKRFTRVRTNIVLGWATDCEKRVAFPNSWEAGHG